MMDRSRILLGIAGMVIALLGPALASEAGTRARQEGLTTRDARLQSSIDAGELHTCTVRNDGTVRCWGYNADGQLGDGTPDRSPRAGQCLRAHHRGDRVGRHLSHLRGARGRQGPLLGRQFQRPARRQLDDPAAHPGQRREPRQCHRDQRGRLPHLRAPGRRHRPVLGRERQRPARRWHHNRPPQPGDGDRAHQRDGGGGGDRPHVRAARGRDRALLGLQWLRPARRWDDDAPAHARRGQRSHRRGGHRRARAELRHPGGRHRPLLGQ